MTNREKFAEQILDIACGGSRMAVNKATLEPIACDELECKDSLVRIYQLPENKPECLRAAVQEAVCCGKLREY